MNFTKLGTNEKDIKEDKDESEETSSEPFSVWGVRWTYKYKKIQSESQYGHFSSYKLRPYIIKGGDDLRQEVICMQLM